MAVKPFFKAAIRPTDSALELMIYEDIGADWFGDGLTAASVKSELDKAVGTYNEIAVRINSPGGDVFEGTAIYNLLRAQGKPVTVYVDGIAASSASIIAMAGDKRVMGPNAMMMIHNAWTMCVGDSGDLRKMADTLDKVNDAIAETYILRTGKSGKEIADLMNAETWLTAKDCLEQGFATEISEQQADADADPIAMARTFKALGRFKNAPDALKDLPDPGLTPNPGAAAPQDNANGCDCGCTECAAGDCAECSDPDCTDPNCEDCPMQEAARNKADLMRMDLDLRVRLARQ
jgi:ATP-dependent Clp protease protease subunit